MREEKSIVNLKKDFKITKKKHCRILNSIGESKRFNMQKEKIYNMKENLRESVSKYEDSDKRNLCDDK